MVLKAWAVAAALGCSALSMPACSSDAAPSAESYVDIAGSPEGITVGAGSIWVANGKAGAVVRLDPTTKKIVATVPVTDDPLHPLLVDGDSLWVPGLYGLTRIDMGSNTLKSTTATTTTATTTTATTTTATTTTKPTVGTAATPTPLASQPVFSIVSLGGRLFANGDGRVVELDPATGERRTTFRLPPDTTTGSVREVLLRPMLGVDGALWISVTDGIHRELAKYDIATGAFAFTHRLAPNEDSMVSIVAAGKTVWTLDRHHALTGIDSTTGKLLACEHELPTANSLLDEFATAMAVGDDGTLWALDQPAQTLYRLDPLTGNVIGTTKLRFRPSSLVVTDDAVWITNFFDGRVTIVDRAKLEPSVRDATKSDD